MPPPNPSVVRRISVMRNLRILLLRFGCGGGGGVELVDVGGGMFTVPGGGGVRGTFCEGIVEADDGVDGVLELAVEVGEVATGPGGGGWFVLELAEPGRTAGLESAMLDLSAYPL
jgi:hypothetical protein